MELIDIQKPEQKIYSDKTILAAAFLTGPVAATYLIAHNFKMFNLPDNARRTWIYGILATIAIFGGIFLIPGVEKVPQIILPVLYTGVVYFLMQRYQLSLIENHIQLGGETYGVLKSMGVALVCVVLTVVPVVAIALALPGGEVVVENYGPVKNEIAYEAGNLSKPEADRIARAFEAAGFFDNEVQKYTYAEKKGNNYEISISCNNSVTSPDAIAYFTQMRNDMQQRITGHKIIFKLVVDDLDNVVKRIE